MGIGWLLYCLCCMVLNLSTTWYTSSALFFIGILWAMKKDNIHKFLDNKKRHSIYFIILLLMFILFFVLNNKLILPLNLNVICKIIGNILFVLLLLNLIMTININNKVLKKIGEISFEIYVSQGIFLLLYHSQIIYIHNAWIYIIVTVVSTIIFACIIQPVFSNINRICKGENRK